MDPFTIPLIVIGALAAGVLAGWLAGLARGAARAERTHARLAADLAASEAARTAVQAQLDHQLHLYRELTNQTRADQAAREERERRDQTVLRALAPVQQTLHSMQTKVDELERERAAQFGSLSEQLRRASEADDALRATTESLAGALRSNSTRGVWGETQLRRVVEAAGLRRYVDFDLQTTIATDAGTGRPDMVIRLPGDKAIAVDAKVPLDAYLEASAIPWTAQGADADHRRALMERHVKAMRAHIDGLGRKRYWAGLGSSPEFVVCFVPNESLLAAALEQDPALLDYAFGKRVALASPVNLWAVLKTVAFTWTQQDVSEQARELLELGSQLYERLGSLTGHAESLRRAIERTVDSYNGLIGSLESRVLVTARRFPGIDDTRLDAVAPPAVIESTPRPLTAPELIPVDLDEVRRRIAPSEEDARR
ncbi:DNA recombination protein RmuC [Microbacterium awajiense]|uniref:DNA recombination protein RmuC n=1 Tax=Microbacterium awajiense TaxID=415214 RepID=A0ABP7AB60_9MICO